ncbi:hypothetical protein DVH05_020658 [Phytophthora capsici]|nr:hypothetical protein DVH05_020658 [Phytophthora capsici]
MDNANTDNEVIFKAQTKRNNSCKFGAIVGLQFMTQASYGLISPVISILMTEYFARYYRGGLPIDCGANPHDQACIDGSRQAAWLSSIYLGIGSVLSFIIAPMLGQASDIYGRKPLLVLSQITRLGLPFSVMYFMQPHGSITPYFLFTTMDNALEIGGVMNASAADIVAPDYRATAFGLLSASMAVGYCSSAFIAPFFSRGNILWISVGIFLLCAAWAMLIISETLPVRTRKTKTRWTVENPFSSISILFRNKLFIELTCLIALTSFVSDGISQILPFYLNASTIVGFNVTDFGRIMLLNGVLAFVGQGILLDPLVKYVNEKGVIVVALVGCLLSNVGVVCTAFYPHKWLVYVLSVPGCVSELSFPAISALKSINSSEEEQGRIQGAIFAARSVFVATGPVIFSLLYAAMSKKSEWSHAFPFAFASLCYLVGIALAVSLSVHQRSSSGQVTSSSSTNFDSDEDTREVETEDDLIDVITPICRTVEDEQSLAEPLLGTKPSPRYYTNV